MANFNDLLANELLMKEFIQAIVSNNTHGATYYIEHNGNEYVIEFSEKNKFSVIPRDARIGTEDADIIKRILEGKFGLC